MRYSNRLPRYHKKPHSVLSLIVVFSTLIAIFLLLAISHTNFLSFFDGVFASTFRVVSAYLITLPLAVAVVILITKNRIFEDFFVPILDVLQSFPSFAILPPLLLLFGHGSLAIIIFLVTEMMWPLVFTTLSAVHTMRSDLSEAATVFGSHGVNRLRYFTLPILFPAIITGSIVAWGEAWEAIIGAELIVSTTGAGAFIGKIYNNGDGRVFAIAIITLMFFIFILNRLIWLPLMHKSNQFATE